MKRWILRLIPLLCIVCISVSMVIPARAATDILIWQQPISLIVGDGNVATFRVGASGSDLTYQWEYSRNGTTWVDTTVTSADTAVLKLTANATRNGYFYRCRIMDSAGNIAYSKAVTLTVSFEPEPVQYLDYILKVDTAENKVTLSFPSEWIYWRVIANTGGDVVDQEYGPSITSEVDLAGLSDAWRLYFLPFGMYYTFFSDEPQAYNGRYLDLKYIPDDAVFDISFSVKLSDEGDPVSYIDSGFAHGIFNDGYLTSVRKTPATSTSENNTKWTIHHTGTVGDHDGFVPSFYIDGASSMVTATYDSFTITFDLDTYLLDMQSTEKTNGLLQKILDELENQGQTLEDILGEQQEQTSWLEKIWNAILALPSQIGEFFSNALGGIGEAVENIWSGGDVGDDLNDAGDVLEDKNEQLGGVVGDLEDSSNALPDMPDDLQNVISGNIGDPFDSDISGLMPWNDDNYSEFWNAMFTPTLASLSVALLLYFVFGKAA